MLDKTVLRRSGVRIGLLLIVFLLFLAHVAGLFDIQLSRGPRVSFTGLWSAVSDSLLVQRLFYSSEFLLLIFTGLVLSLTLPLLSPIWASLLTLLVIIPPVYGNYAGLFSSPLVPMEYQLLTILMLFIVNVLIGYFEESHEKQRIIETFRHYVPPQIVSKICRNPEQISLDGESRNMTVIFSDLKDFSSVAEELNPKQLTRLLNEYFTAMTKILYEHDATIDKFIGDAIMAFWGAPLVQLDHAERAVNAAFDMHREIVMLTDRFRQRDWPAPEMYIGINTGLMNVGNMGSEYRIAYTVIGDAVNVASRLQELTRDYHVATIVSENTATAADSYLFRTLDRLLLRGKHKRTRIYQPLCKKTAANPELLQFLERHEQAIGLLSAQKADEAIKAFEALSAERPDDPYYRAMLEKLSATGMGPYSDPAPPDG